MKIERVTSDEAHSLLDYEPETGRFIWKQSLSNRRPAGTQAGTRTKRGCIAIGINGRVYKAHHLALLMANFAWPTGDVDHIDGDPTNNALRNLRQVTHKTNCENTRRPRSTNRTGYLGVHLCAQTGRYRASIHTEGRCKQLGRFDTPEKAYAAYLEAKRVLHGGCTL